MIPGRVGRGMMARPALASERALQRSGSPPGATCGRRRQFAAESVENAPQNAPQNATFGVSELQIP